MKTFDCAPTMTDREVLDFCKRGFVVLPGVVPDEINRRTYEFLRVHREHLVNVHHEEWFVKNVILNPAVTGVARSLLGRNFGLPNRFGNHRSVGTRPPQNWHVDGEQVMPPELPGLLTFHYPQEVTLEMGPTELLPGSHHLRSLGVYMDHYDRIRGTYLGIIPAGSVIMMAQRTWHRRSAATAPPDSERNMLMYDYWRTTPPKRDWIIEPNFDLATADYLTNRIGQQATPSFRPQFRDTIDNAEMFFWLSGRASDFGYLGGMCWPLSASNHNFRDEPAGYPPETAAPWRRRAGSGSD